MDLKQDIISYLRSGETEGKRLGLEIEHFAVDKEGRQIDFDTVTSLIRETAEETGAKIYWTDGYPVGYFADSYSITLEPSCQFEISIDPYSDIDIIKGVYSEFYDLWAPKLASRGYTLINKGNLPLVELGIIDPDEIPLSSKKRYKYMDAYFRNSGRYGKYMMRASASVQVSIDFSSEKDLVRKLRLVQIISPILMAVMENKTDEESVLVPGSDRKHLLRIQEWEDLDPSRTGFYPHSFDADFGYEKIADTVIHTPLILLTCEGETTGVGDDDASDLFGEGILTEDVYNAHKKELIEHFISMGFFHVRIKKFLEIRGADSVSIEKAVGYVALIKGLFYNDKNLDILEKRFGQIDSIEPVREALEAVERDGIEASVYEDISVCEWYAYLADLAGQVLSDRERDYLKNV